MAVQKIYAGTSLRETRARSGLTQRVFAERLGISLPYLSQMENNHRPISAGVLLRLAQEFGVDLTTLSAGDAERMVIDMQEALADPIFDTAPPLNDLRLAATNAPSLARAFLDLYRAHRQGQERLAALDEAIGAAGQNALSTPWEEVRDFFHYCDNYIDAVDRAAERFACPDGVRADPWQAAVSALAKSGIRIREMELPANAVFRRSGNEIHLNAAAESATRVFQLLHLVAVERQSDLLEAMLDLARFRDPAAREIARVGMANYFAGAALMPYRAFLAAAQAERHDLERLAHLFGASLEQVAHRLSTLQRPGAKGVPFFFVRVDQAGTITKRHSATRLQFARFGGACPLWNVHRAFEQPRHFLRQLAETPDGVRYLLLARDVSKHAGAFDAPVRRFAIGLGCEIGHAGKLVYGDGLDLSRPRAFEPIGISCRICPRRDCHQRSVPPIDRPLRIPTDRNGPLPYEIA
ncbi:MAG: helix-turn-helix domain-containing protein [Paracoccus sp. (in: a-proteobacteria)]|uniref:helix-turn-helix domain-containing protein n=1 Tax=unclassified Paracoccus (in: a-proteobacteria) TaxID=2688777 RepID=UPI000C3AFC92|nr:MULTISPECIES: helix-turn-helix transcriptional regulator [unclassified Paracoccus (in: a-proteobacteria)]MAN55463.1 Cro/Cl family transcriptional regulator [Paracoccus sp. (in: a-proteobacteria)]MBA49244.1 Cro/Cl family transcriptional regulator [Paracoccus sp. (in: a-proteobacteria)]|tara:strand:+ start:6006 stop:7403 length:1398 start_codon:yes stop_codon:yes gene_type:complete